MSSDAASRPRWRAAVDAAEAWSAASRFAVVALLLVVIFVFFSIDQPDFLTNSNI